MSYTGEAVLHRDESVDRPGAVETAKRGWARILLPGLVVALAVIPKLWSFDADLWGSDEAMLLIYPEQMREGRIPNQDFFTVYGAGNYITLNAVYSLLGQTLLAERLVGLAYHVLIVIGVMRLTRRHGLVASVTAGMLSAVLLQGPNLVAFSWLGGLGLSLWSLAWLHRDGKSAAVAAGVLAGLVTFWRIEMGVLAIAALPLVWRSNRFRSYFVGACIGSAPALLHMAISGRQVLHNVILDRMGLNAQLDWSLLTPSLVVLAALLVVAGVGLLVLAMLGRDQVLLSEALLALLLLPQAFQRIDGWHVVFFTGIVVFPIALAPVIGIKRTWRKSWRRVAPSGCAMGLVLLTTMFTMQAVASPSGQEATHLGRSVYLADAETVESLITAINHHVPAGSRVFVGSSDMSVATTSRIELYHLLREYRHDFYFMELSAGVAERAGSPLVHDIESADALVLSDYVPEVKLLFPHFPQGANDANRVVAKKFCPVDRVGSFTLFTAKVRGCQ